MKNVRTAGGPAGALLVAKCLDGVEARGFPGGVEAEENADRGGEHEAAGNCSRRDRGWPTCDYRYRCGKSYPRQNAGDAATHAQENRFGQKLKQYVQTASPNGHAQADFPRALADRYEQNVHDADAADYERDRGDVRSLTDTSRMFMMPMSPTTSEIEATAARRSAMMWLLVWAVSAI